MSTGYLGDRGQMIYADNKISNMAWYYDSLYVPDGAMENRDGFAHDVGVTSVEVVSLTQQDGVTVLTCNEVNGVTGHAELPLLYYPGYTVLDGQGIVFRTENGMVGVTVPANYSGEIRVAFREPKRWLAADLVSLATALVLVERLAIHPRLKKRKKKAA